MSMIPSSSTPGDAGGGGVREADETQRTCVEGVVDLEYTQGEVDHIGDLGGEALDVRAQRSLWAHWCSRILRTIPRGTGGGECDERITGAGVERDV